GRWVRAPRRNTMRRSNSRSASHGASSGSRSGPGSAGGSGGSHGRRVRALIIGSTVVPRGALRYYARAEPCPLCAERSLNEPAAAPTPRAWTYTPTLRTSRGWTRRRAVSRRPSPRVPDRRQRARGRVPPTAVAGAVAAPGLGGPAGAAGGGGRAGGRAAYPPLPGRQPGLAGRCDRLAGHRAGAVAADRGTEPGSRRYRRHGRGVVRLAGERVGPSAGRGRGDHAGREPGVRAAARGGRGA